MNEEHDGWVVKWTIPPGKVIDDHYVRIGPVPREGEKVFVDSETWIVGSVVYDLNVHFVHVHLVPFVSAV